MNVIDELKPYLKDFLQRYYNVNPEKNFKCISGTHPDKHPSMSYQPKKHYVKCFSCGYTGNIVSVASDYWNVPPNIAIEKLKKEYCIDDCNYKDGYNYIDYLASRGLKEETIKHFQIKYEPNFIGTYTGKDDEVKNFNMGAVVKIPSDTNSDFHLIRSVQKKKFYKPNGLSEPLFFMSELLQFEPVFVVESVFCAMSIWQCGGHAVALNGTGYNKLLSALSSLDKVPPIILSLDKDPAGQKASEMLYDELIQNDYQVINYPVSASEKDPNELLMKNADELKSEINKAINAIKTENQSSTLMKDYIAYSFLGEIRKRKELSSNRKSGFPSLDDELSGFGEGLYILGGRPGVGKTTFLDQLSYNLSETIPVMYFSYEQQKIHFASKQLSRLSYQLTDKPFKSRDILAGNLDRNVLEMMGHYLDSDRDIHVYSEQYTVEALQNKVKHFEDKQGISPIVIIDFIQKVPVTNKNSAKDSVDYVVANLERFTHEGRRTVILVSSFNRGGYYNQISIDSFRESGNLEYAADVILGLQYHAFSENQVFKSDNKLMEKQAIIKAEELKKVREIDLVCSKNRYGSQFSIPMIYHTEYDTFEEAKILKPIQRI